jgi:hypothetical protein
MDTGTYWTLLFELQALSLRGTQMGEVETDRGCLSVNQSRSNPVEMYRA